jgi:hypothetical protein
MRGRWYELESVHQPLWPPWHLMRDGIRARLDPDLATFELPIMKDKAAYLSDRARHIALDSGLTSKVGEPAQTPAEQKDEYHQGPNANSKSIKPASRQDLVWHPTAL